MYCLGVADELVGGIKILIYVGSASYMWSVCGHGLYPVEKWFSILLDVVSVVNFRLGKWNVLLSTTIGHQVLFVFGVERVS